MRKTTTLALACAVVLLISMSAVVIGQTSEASSALDYSLIFRPPSDARPVKAQVPVFSWQNSRGRNVTTDSLGMPIINRGCPVAIVLADSTTLAGLYGRTAQTWVMTVTDTTRIGTGHGMVGLTILDLNHGTTRDTSLQVSALGRMCPGLIIDSVAVGFAPYDSVDVGDRTIFTWQTSTWQ